MIQTYFLLYQHSLKVNSTTYVCLRRNYELLFIITYWSYFECNDILHTLDVYKTISNELQADDSWAKYQMSVSEILFWKYLKYVPLILPNCKRLKKTKIATYKIFSYFNYLIKFCENCRINCRKVITCPLNIIFLRKFLYRVTMKSLFLM